MKIRLNYISNSSSASFVVYNWFNLPLEKRNYIMNYDNNALKVWQENKIPFSYTDWKEIKTPYFDIGLVSNLSYNNKNLDEDTQDLIYCKLESFAFGYLQNDCMYSFKENKERNNCVISSSMDNFDMEKWLEYNKIDFDIIERN